MYIRCSPLYHTSWPGWGSDAFRGWLHYCKYGIPGLIMVCLDLWTFEVGFLVVGGTSANPKVEIGIYSIMNNVCEQLYSFTVGYAMATNVRIGNLLGANNPSLARKVACLCLGNICVIGVLFFVGLFLLKSQLPYLFTTDACIIAGVSQTLIIIAIFENFDGLQSVASGVLKGCGRQGIASITNLIIFQFIATPLAVCLSVVLKMDTRGYWIGMATAIFLQAVIYLTILFFTNWRRVADIAQENAGISQITTKENISLLSSLLESPDSNPNHKKGKKFVCRDMMKLSIIFLFISSFVCGVAFSFKHQHIRLQFNITIYNNSSLSVNTTTQSLCPY
ncbi:Multidrug and toxin extrusion protein 1-like [Oopsacas minuta]|nr:Multidrug and toxin extrusion protein 1-like [Oopsacas minuta]